MNFHSFEFPKVYESRGFQKEKGSYKGSYHFAFYSEVAEMINEKLAELETTEFKNDEEEVKYIKSQIRDMFKVDEFTDHIKRKAKKIFEVEWSDNTWLENAQTFFTSNLIEMSDSKILRKDANGNYKLDMDATFNAYAIAKDTLELNMLENIPFFVIKNKLTGKYNTITYEQLQNELHREVDEKQSRKYDLDGSFTVVHRGKGGKIENGLLLLYDHNKNSDAQIDLDDINSEEPIHIGFKEVVKNKDGIFEELIKEGIFINRYDKDSNENRLLVGPVRLNPKTLQLESVNDEKIAWLLYEALKEESTEFHGSEDIDSYFTLEHVRSNLHQVGSKVSFVLQKVHTKIVPTGPYQKHVTAFDPERHLQKMIDNLQKAEIGKGTQTERDLIFASSLICQLAQKTSQDEVIVFDDVFRISSKGFQISPEHDPIEYSREHFKNVLRQMNPDGSTLAKITHYNLLNRETGKFEWNDLDVKSFFQTWLDKIKTSIAFAEDPDIKEEVINYFSEFRSLKKCEFSKEDGINEDDIQIIERVRDALIEVFGYEFFTLLINGVMTIYLTPSGEYKLYFKNHKTRDLEDQLQKFGLFSVKDSGSITYWTASSYSGSITYWTASLLIGSRLKLSKTDTLHIIPPSPLLGDLFENTRDVFDIKGMGIQEIVKYNAKLLEKFYNNYFKDLVPPVSLGSIAYWGNDHLILEGTQVLVEIMKDAFEKSRVEEKLINEYPELGEKEKEVKQVATKFMLRTFVQGLYSSSKGYKDQLIKALIQGEGFITIGYKLRGKGQTNPIFLINDETNHKGYKVRIPIDKFTNEVKAKIIWSLMMSNSQLINLKTVGNVFPLIDSIKHEIKGPIKHIYKQLYETLEKYNREGYYVTKDGEKTKGTFQVNFYAPSAGGYTDVPKKIEASKTIIKLDPSDLLYKYKLASVVSLMVKNMYTIVIRQKFENNCPFINVLYADQFGILDERCIKLNFYSKQISGTLYNNYIDKEENQWKTSEIYRDLKEEDYKKGSFTLKNSFPLWLFVETEEYTYNKIIARIFNEASYENPIYPQINPDWYP